MIGNLEKRHKIMWHILTIMITLKTLKITSKTLKNKPLVNS